MNATTAKISRGTLTSETVQECWAGFGSCLFWPPVLGRNVTGSWRTNSTAEYVDNFHPLPPTFIPILCTGTSWEKGTSVPMQMCLIAILMEEEKLKDIIGAILEILLIQIYSCSSVGLVYLCLHSMFTHRLISKQPYRLFQCHWVCIIE